MEKIKAKKGELVLSKKKSLMIEKTFSLNNGLYEITGANGSGKTVFLEYLSGYRHSKLIENKSDTKKTLFLGELGIGMEDLTLLENIRLTYWIFGLSFEDSILAKIKQFYSEEQLHTLYSQASFGMQLMVGLSLLFSTVDWEMIVLDETLSGIDKQNKEIFLAEIEKRQKEALVLFVSHEGFDKQMTFKEIAIHEGKIDCQK